MTLTVLLEMVVVVERGMFGAAQLFIKPPMLTSSASVGPVHFCSLTPCIFYNSLQHTMCYSKDTSTNNFIQEPHSR
jgi:hypothetical protein